MSSGKIALSELSLFPATPDQIFESRKRAAAHWARDMTVEEFIRRDEIMIKEAHSADGKLTVWVLAPRNDPQTTQFVCSCKTFRRSAIVAKRATARVEEAIGYGIASVYTPPWNRKKGYAAHMMRLLHWVLAPRSALPPSFPEEWGAPPDLDMLRSRGLANAQFSVLYSDVGPHFYHSCGTDATSRTGWVVTGAQATSRVVDDAVVHPPPGQSDDANYQRLTEEDVAALFEHDSRWMEADLSGPSQHTRFAFLSNEGVGMYPFRRTMRVPETQPVLQMSQWGIVRLPPSANSISEALEQHGEASLSFVAWTLDIWCSPPTLVVTRLRADKDTMDGLMEQLLTVARSAGVEKVEIWDLKPELRVIAERSGWKTQDRVEHLSSVKWYGDESEHEIQWVHNEKFCWC